MSTILTVKNGLKYLKSQRSNSTKQETWDYYTKEIERLEGKLYELEITKELDEYGSTPN